MTGPVIEVFDSPAVLAAEAAQAIEAALADALSARGKASLVATGGRSPGAIYDKLAQAKLDWSKIDVTLSDERWVEPSHADSNEKLVRERLLTGNAAGAGFVPLKHPLGSAEESAEAATSELAPLAPFDVVTLGMGEDGHIASLFPGNAALAAGLDPGAPQLAIGVPKGDPAPNIDRISLTLAALKTSHLTLILTSGAAKRAVLEGEADKPVHAFLRAAEGKVRVLWTA